MLKEINLDELDAVTGGFGRRPTDPDKLNAIIRDFSRPRGEAPVRERRERKVGFPQGERRPACGCGQ